jgi:hypothetical protein
MAMKKTSGGDSPLPIFGSTVAADRDVFWKSDWVFRFFPSGGLYRRRGISGVDRGGLTNRGRGPAPGRAALVCGPLVAPLRLLFGSLEASVKFWATGFCFVQFREYFLCNFSETQNSRKQGTGTMATC